MRNGANPNRSASVRPYAPIVVSAITHMPNQEGYHSKRFDVIRASLETMRSNAGMDCEILVWDNGSCSNLKGWLINNYRPDYLIFSRNVGKSIARASIVRMLPPDRIVGVADDDMFYYPDWLKRQAEVLTVYPNVGTVSGWPVRTQFRFHCLNTIMWGKDNAEMEVGKLIPPDEDRDFCTSIGRDYEWHSGPYTEKDLDYKLTYRGVETYATGHHAQWIGIAGIVAPFVAYTPEAMADERPFEKAVDDAGMLRLTTFRRTSQHIGNVLDERLEALWHDYVT
jgi:glycosyltransferase involved in cell wall biosynthesis